MDSILSSIESVVTQARNYAKGASSSSQLADTKDNTDSDINISKVKSGQSNPSTTTNFEQHKVLTRKRKNSKLEKIEKQAEILKQIFPNNDPGCLLKMARTTVNYNKIELSEFINMNLDDNRFMKRADYDKQVEERYLRKKYSTDFDIVEFVKTFPDPWSHFCDDTDVDCRIYKGQSVRYLKIKFVTHYVTDLHKALIKNEYSLYKSYHKLKDSKGSRKTVRRECDELNMIPFNVNFLQEVAFIENEEKIRDYIENKKLKLKEAKENGKLVECLCCCDSEQLVEDVIFCSSNHRFCQDCVKRSVEIAIADGKNEFECLEQCTEKFPLSVLQPILEARTYSKLLLDEQSKAVKAAGVEDLIECPYCSYVTILGPDERVLKCLNQDCMKESCRYCRQLDHCPLKCSEVERSAEIAMRTYIEDRMTAALVRTCYNCKRMFVKEDGCNKMSCPCGAKMCYICQRPVTDYKHFNGQGGTEFTKCPLYSNNNELHVDAVIHAAQVAKEEVLEKNPGKRLKVDPTLILPERTNDQRALHAPGVNGLPLQ